MNIDFLTQCGRVKKTSVEMMKDRGYDITDEAWILDEKRSDLSISLVFLKRSAERGVSFCSSLSKMYTAAAHAATKSADKKEPPPSIAVHFLDRNFDEVRQRDKMVSTDQFKSVLREFSKQNLAQHLCLISHLDTIYSLIPHEKVELAQLCPLAPLVLD